MERDRLNIATVGVTVRSSGAWKLIVVDPNTGPNRGHLSDDRMPQRVLANVLTAAVGSNAPVSLDGRSGGIVATGSGSVGLLLDLRQPVASSDVPGVYAMHLDFLAIAGF